MDLCHYRVNAHKKIAMMTLWYCGIQDGQCAGGDKFGASVENRYCPKLALGIIGWYLVSSYLGAAVRSS
jgi:hypothetical protein